MPCSSLQKPTPYDPESAAGYTHGGVDDGWTKALSPSATSRKRSAMTISSLSEFRKVGKSDVSISLSHGFRYVVLQIAIVGLGYHDLV
jgi:hypothetical protein